MKTQKINFSTSIQAADAIGAKICRQAFWYRSKCNWMGTTAQQTKLPYVQLTSNRALGPDLYDGSSGIALFLAYLYAKKNRDEYFHTAVGAIKRSVSHIKDIDQFDRFGLYSGRVGVSYVAAELGNVFRDERLVEQALLILKSLLDQREQEHSVDMISGSAGAIPTLLRLGKMLDEQDLVDLAVYLGENLLKVAVKEKVGWSWHTHTGGLTPIPHHNLTGFAHGAAGIGYSLVQLFLHTDKNEFREAAKQAFSYENHWFSKRHNNWPDFRLTTSGMKDDTEDRYYYHSRAWCHGAPGIGFSRLNAYKTLGDGQFLKDAEIAVSTTIQSIKEASNIDRIDFSLCHGLTGLCDLLIYADSIFKKKSNKALISKLIAKGLERYGTAEPSWPCGIDNSGTPALMLGLAGIGYFLLRLSDPGSIPSILIIE